MSNLKENGFSFGGFTSQEIRAATSTTTFDPRARWIVKHRRIRVDYQWNRLQFGYAMCCFCWNAAVFLSI